MGGRGAAAEFGGDLFRLFEADRLVTARLGAQIDQCPLAGEVVRDAGHMMIRHQPAEIARRLLAFLA